MESHFTVADRLVETHASTIHVNGDVRRIDRMAMKVLVGAVGGIGSYLLLVCVILV